MDLTGRLLIAMPGMQDPRFEHSVVLVCAHNDDGAMGFIINKPVPEAPLSEMLAQLSIEVTDRTLEDRLHFGGPVETGRGFVLHSEDYRSPMTSLDIPGGYRLTATVDVLEAIASGQGPSRRLVALGYAGWGAGQLEGEIAANGWLVAEPDPRLVFELPAEEKWKAAIDLLGIDPQLLSVTSGRA